MKAATPIYNLKAVIRETGLSPATLRAWERRYGLIKPQRSPGGHRLYSEHDIALLKWLVARQEEGLSISHAIELWQSLERTTPNPFQQLPTPQPVANARGNMLDNLRSNWVEACLAFDEAAAEQAMAQAFAIAAPEIVCAELLQKGLAEFGERWYSGAASVQQEHFASALAMRRLSALFAAAPIPTRSGRILAACPPGEAHDFSLLMLAFILRRHGWEVIYLGANVPLSRLDITLRQTTPRLAIAVAQTLHSAAALSDMASYVSALSIPLAYGGGIFNQVPALTGRIPGHFLGYDLSAVPQIVELLLTHPVEPPKPEPISREYAAALTQFTEKEALILSRLVKILQTSPDTAAIDPRRLEEANTNFTRYITSALALGDIHFLDYSVGWLKGLLENHGVSPSMAQQYYAAYRQSVHEHLGDDAAPILDWLRLSAGGFQPAQFEATI